MKAKFLTSLTVLTLTLLAAGCASSHDSMMMDMANAPTKAMAIITPTKGNDVSGVIYFTQDGNDKVHVVADIDGLAPGSVHGFHIHEFGDISGGDGMTTGAHYNPEGHKHGLPGGPRQAGDLGNVTANAKGHAHLDVVFNDISICCGKNPILGRSVVLHEKKDDGTGMTGNAGSRIGLGVIGVAK